MGMIGKYKYTGSHTVSTFIGKGKVNMLKLMNISQDPIKACTELGEEQDASDELLNKLEKVTCLIYAENTTTDNVK